MNAVASKQVLDTKFIVAAAVIGAVYATVVATMAALVGKEAAGVAGVALTALATGIFKQFETLRFRQVSDDEQVEIQVPRLSWWRVTVLAIFFFGLKVFIGMLAGFLLVLTNVMPQVSGFEAFSDVLVDSRVLVAIVGLNVAAYVFGGFLVAKAFRLDGYSTILIAALISCVLDSLVPLIPVAVREFALFIEILTSGVLWWPAAFWLIYLAAAFIGAKLATRALALPAMVPTEA